MSNPLSKLNLNAGDIVNLATNLIQLGENVVAAANAKDQAAFDAAWDAMATKLADSNARWSAVDPALVRDHDKVQPNVTTLTPTASAAPTELDPSFADGQSEDLSGASATGIPTTSGAPATAPTIPTGGSNG